MHSPSAAAVPTASVSLERSTALSVPDEPLTTGAPAALPRRWSWVDWALLLAILVVAGLIRFDRIDPSPSFDELWHIATTKGYGNALNYFKRDIVYLNPIHLTTLEDARPFWHIWSGMDGVLHPPLYIITLRLWRDVMGDGELMAHAFSITCALISIGLCYATARLAMDRTIAAILAFAMAVAQTQVYVAQEVRPYAMLCALGSVAVWQMTRVQVLGPTRRRAATLGLLTLPLQLTHYFAFGGALAIVVFGLLRMGPWRKVFVACVAASALIFIVAWGPFAVQQIKWLGTGDVFLKVNPFVPSRELALASAVPFRLLADRDYSMDLTPILSGVLFIVPWLLVRKFRPLLPWALWMCGTIGALVALDTARSTIHVVLARYIAIASPAVPLLFAGVPWAVRQKYLAYATALFVAFTGGIYLYSRNAIGLECAEFGDVNHFLEPRIAPGEALVTYAPKDSPEVWMTDVLALQLSHSKTLFPRPLLVLDAPMTPEMMRALGTRRLWLICPSAALPKEAVPGGTVLETVSSSMLTQTVHFELPALASDELSGATSMPASVPADGPAGPAR